LLDHLSNSPGVCFLLFTFPPSLHGAARFDRKTLGRQIFGTTGIKRLVIKSTAKAVSMKHSVDKMSIGQMSVGKMTVSLISVGQKSVGLLSVGQMPIYKMSVGQMSVNQISVVQMSVGQRSVG
jgi:hypothetical protein